MIFSRSVYVAFRQCGSALIRNCGIDWSFVVEFADSYLFDDPMVTGFYSLSFFYLIGSLVDFCSGLLLLFMMGAHWCL